MRKPSTRHPHVAPVGGMGVESASSGDSGGSLDTAFPLVAIGASAGGLSALTLLLKHLPPTTGMAFVLLQHLDPGFVCEALAGATGMTVRAISGDVQLQPNEVYVLPPDGEVAIHDGRLTTTPRSPDGRWAHLPVDAFLRAVASHRRNAAIGVLLSGSTSDGVDGLGAIKEADGITFAQRPETAKYDVMPRSAVEAGVVDACLPLPELAQELVRLSAHPYLSAPDPRLPENDESLAAIFAAVFSKVGVDFTEYKASSWEPRIARRMAIRGVGHLRAYLGVLRTEPDEARHLSEDLLIHATGFFRDPEVFEGLNQHAFPQIMKDRAPKTPIRIWIAGCSTGQEVYSVAIALLERLGETTYPIHIFGSDVSGRAVQKARRGVYSEAELAGVSEARRKRFFRRVDGGYRIAKSVRELCVFAQHDLARAPPFSKLDLVSCRNVLVYFGQALQERLLFAFHYALRQPGFLLLGRDDAAVSTNLFVAADGAAPIFARVAAAIRGSVAPAKAAAAKDRQATGASSYARPKADFAPQLDRLLVSRFAPPGVLVNERLEILQFYGQTGAFLQAPPGEPQNNLIKMARDGLVPTLYATIARAKKTMTSVIAADVKVEHDGFATTCNVVVLPCAGAVGAKDQLYVVLFEEPTAPGAKPVALAEGVQRKGARQKDALDELARIAQLEQELAATRHYLEALIREHGDATDDLGAANEELVSGNEELQSVNEELESAKEELQSMNEELTTVNEELHDRNQDMARVNDDLVNLLRMVEIPVVILDRDRRIRRFTPDAQHVFNLIAADLDRPLQDIRSNLVVSDLDAEIARVIVEATPQESEVKDRTGRWYRMQLRPYRTADGTIDGAIVSLVDIDALKHHLAQAQEAAANADRANRGKDEFLATLSHELRAPLSGMLLYAQMLRRGELEGAQLARAGEVIEQGVDRQVRLIDDLLDVSRIVTGKLVMDRAPVEVAAVIDAALASVGAEADAKAMTIQVHLAPVGRVFGAFTRLRQIVLNLLLNAIKFTPQGGRITVTLDELHEQARITVADNGIGIDAELLPRVFGRLTQDETSLTRTQGGLGLGLALVRHFVGLHGGVVEATSAGPGHGATFTVLLPLLNESQASPSSTLVEESPDVPVGAELRGVRILVVDDDASMRAAVARILALSGAETRVAASAEAGMAALSDFKPQVLVSDIAMPGEDGYTFIRRVRAHSVHGASVPALALTVLAGDEDRARVLSAGFDLHVTKPVDGAHLTRSIARLSREALARELA